MTARTKELWDVLPINEWVPRENKMDSRSVIQLSNAKLIELKFGQDFEDGTHHHHQYVRRRPTNEIADIYANPQTKPKLTKRGRKLY